MPMCHFQKQRAIFLAMMSYQKILTSWQGFQNPPGSCNIKIFHFAYINKIFANITKEIYLDANKENVIFLARFLKLSVHIDRLAKYQSIYTKKLTLAKFDGSGTQIKQFSNVYMSK